MQFFSYKSRAAVALVSNCRPSSRFPGESKRGRSGQPAMLGVYGIARTLRHEPSIAQAAPPI
jgi:hypothetical protein